MISCSSPKSHKQSMIDKFKNSVSLEVFNSIPTTEVFINGSLSQNILFPESIYASKYCGVFIEYKYSDVEFKNKLNDFEVKNIFESDIKDSCNKYIPVEINKQDCSKEYLPVPNITDDFNELKDKTLEGKYLVFNYQPGEFLNNKTLLKGDKHGFSNGVIIEHSSNKMIYWIVIW